MEVPYENRPYRQNVAAVVLNDQGRILVCQRSDFPDSWQLPQGGIDAGESPEQALYRELEEEIGTREVELLGRLADVIRYDWPEEVAHPAYRGQEQIYFLLRLRADAKIDFSRKLPAEFSNYEWLGAEEFLRRLNRSRRGGFKAEAYREALSRLKQFFPGMLAE